jgi:hypothetical protein
VNVVDVDATEKVLAEVADERHRQDAKWGQQNHPDLYPDTWCHGDDNRAHYAYMADYWKAKNANRVEVQNNAGAPSDRNAAWDGILLEEVYEALAEEDPAKIRAELVQVAAVAAAWIEAIDRRAA